MNFRALPSLLLTGLVVSQLAACATTQPAGVLEWDGLERQAGTRLDAVFVRPNAAIPAFRTVMLDPVDVRFAQDWDPNRGRRGVGGRLSADDLLTIKTTVAGLFQEVFREELASGGYELVETPGPDTLRVVPAILDLVVSAPEPSTGRQRSYTANPGRMTLVIELRDSVTGEVLARAVDTQGGRPTGTWTVANRFTNTREARRAIGVWASALRQGLDELHRQGK